MRSGAPPLLPLLRSRIQGDMLALLYLHPDEGYSVTEIARLLASSVPGVHAEVERLVRAGYLRDERVGNMRRVSAATDTPVFRPLTDLLAVTFGPKPVLTDALEDVAGIEEAYIFGSWASRYAGDAGPIPNDVDVLVVGTTDPDDVDDAARAAQIILRRPVNVTRLRPTAWRSAAPRPFVRAVKAGALVPLEVGSRESSEHRAVGAGSGDDRPAAG